MVALKEVRGDKATDEQRRQLMQEALRMRELGNNPHVVQYIGLCIDNKPNIYIVMEYCAGGNLESALRNRNRRAEFDLSVKRGLAVDIIAGLLFLNKQGLVHRDMAARNVLLYERDRRLVAKVSDLGMARDKASPLPDSPATFRWCAPEVLAYGLYTESSDVWAFGVVYWELMSFGQLPFADILDNNGVKNAVLQGNTLQHMPCPPGCAKEDYNVMVSCWQPKPVDRPKFSVLLQYLENLQISAPPLPVIQPAGGTDNAGLRSLSAGGLPLMNNQALRNSSGGTYTGSYTELPTHSSSALTTDTTKVSHDLDNNVGSSRASGYSNLPSQPPVALTPAGVPVMSLSSLGNNTSGNATGYVDLPS